MVDTLRQRWGQEMPDTLITDDLTNDMLIALEHIILHNYGHVFTSKSSTVLNWRSPKAYHMLPLPILGLEHTLGLYGVDRSIRMDAITVLDLRDWSLTCSIFHCFRMWLTMAVVPRWIMRFPHLRLLHLQNNPIQFLPSWIIKFPSLVHICANNMFCRSCGPSETPVERVYPVRCTKLVDLISAIIRQDVDEGGDWTVVSEALPPHLVDRISACPPLIMEKQVVQFKETDQLFVIENVKESLRGTRWKESPTAYVQGAGDPEFLPLYIPRKK